LGGTASKSGEICAIRMKASPDFFYVLTSNQRRFTIA
jgi:hypothetical protein